MKYPIRASVAPAILLALLTVAALYVGTRFLQDSLPLVTFDRIVWGNMISPVILFLFFVVMFLIYSKRRRRVQDQKLSRRFLSEIAPRLYDQKTTLDDVSEHAARFGESVLGQRWNRYHIVQGTADVARIEQRLGETDMEYMQNSYSMIRYLVWALPIIGFIGTVWGIGLSISFFSDTMSSSQAGASVSALLQQNIPLVTKGLSTAFDTTLLALVLSVPATGYMVVAERAERDYLADLDERWTRFLALSRPRLTSLTRLDIALDEQVTPHLQAVDESVRDLREDLFENLNDTHQRQSGQ